jgi:hypothetical protein
MSYTTLQTAETLDPGRVEVGAGALVMSDGALPELGGRIGVIKNMDVGIKYSAPYLLVIDGKYQFIDAGIDGSVDFGWSNFNENGVRTNGYYPMIIFGQKHWYGGVKLNYLTSKGNVSLLGDEKYTFSKTAYYATNIIAGAMIGTENFHGLIELNTHITKTRTFYLPAVGFYFGF